MGNDIHGPHYVPGTERKRLISGSSRNAHTGCFRRWELQNIRGVRRVLDAMAPSIGTLGHNCLAEFYQRLHSGNKATPLMRWDKMLMEWETETIDLLEKMENPFVKPSEVRERVYNLRGGLHHWYSVYGERDAYDVEVLLVEAPFRVPLAQRWKGGWRVHPMYAYAGKIDLLIHHKVFNRRYLVDHKFTGAADVRMYKDDITTIGNGQRVGYVYAIGDYVMPGEIHGIRYDTIRMKCPSTPSVLQCRKCKGTGMEEIKTKRYVEVEVEKKTKRYEDVPKADGSGTKKTLVKDADGMPIFDIVMVAKTVLERDADGKQVYDVSKQPCGSCNATGIGGVSSSKCDTTAAHYIAEVDRLRALNPDLILDGVDERIAELKLLGDRFAIQFDVSVSETEVFRWMDDTNEVARSMTAQYKAHKQGRRLIRNLSACKWGNMKCDYLSVCEHDSWESNAGFKVVPSDPFKPYEADGDDDNQGNDNTPD
jgi:hypothetical protein